MRRGRIVARVAPPWKGGMGSTSSRARTASGSLRAGVARCQRHLADEAGSTKFCYKIIGDQIPMSV